MAEYEILKHEWKMLAAIGKLMGVDGLKLHGENRQKALDLFLRVVSGT